MNKFANLIAILRTCQVTAVFLQLPTYLPTQKLPFPCTYANLILRRVLLATNQFRLINEIGVTGCTAWHAATDTRCTWFR